MARPYKVTWKYQHDEEILQSSCWYFDPADNPFEVGDLGALAGSFGLRLAQAIDEYVPAGFEIWSLEVSTPAVGNEGPSRWINAIAGTMDGNETTRSMDSFVANAQLRGENALGEAVAGGFKLSIVPREIVNRNQLDSTWVTNVEAALEFVFPQQVAIDAGNIERCIRSVRPPADPEYVWPTELTVSQRIGTNLTRVGNRPQRNAGPIVVE